MAYEVPSLPYDYAALEPHIDEQTMRIHHDKHHQAYVDKANAALEGTEWADKPVEEVLRNLDRIPEDKRKAVRNNGGGHADAINQAFGGVEDLKQKVNDAAVNQFGSGWSWVVLDGGSLAVIATPNQDTPTSDGKIPILGVDVWEHAYYLKYQNRRPDYLTAWWNVINWPEVARRYQEAAKLAGAVR
jgi:Fe-Mn family superoxide dismutase